MKDWKRISLMMALICLLTLSHQQVFAEWVLCGNGGDVTPEAAIACCNSIGRHCKPDGGFKFYKTGTSVSCECERNCAPKTAVVNGYHVQIVFDVDEVGPDSPLCAVPDSAEARDFE